MAEKIKRSDRVLVTVGKHKGSLGDVTRSQKGWVTVSGVNLVKKHVKPNPDRGVQGGILEKEMPIRASNVSLYYIDPVSQKPRASKVGFRVLKNGKKVRYLKKTDQVIDI